MSAFGWLPDLPDYRDHAYKLPKFAVLPERVDLRGSCPPVLDQGQLGSCTANAIASAHQYQQIKQTFFPQFMPSRLFIYYNERIILGTVSYDSGACIRDGIKSIASQGVPTENSWPYEIARFRRKPSTQCYSRAMTHQALEYMRISYNLEEMKACLADGHPFIFGFGLRKLYGARCRYYQTSQYAIAKRPGARRTCRACCRIRR